MNHLNIPETVAPAANGSTVKAIKAYKMHPASTQLPEMDDAMYLALRDNIEKHGLQVPLRLCDGLIIDGRARYRACLELGIEPEVQVVPSGLSDDAALAAHNLIRKHWPEGTRAILAAQLASRALGFNQHSTTDSNGSLSQTDAARRLGVSVDSLQRAKKVLERGNVALARAAQEGKLAMSVAYSAARRLHDAELQAAFDSGEKIGIERSMKIALADSTKRKKDAWSAKRAAICEGDEPLPIGQQYDVILVDPPTDHIPERELNYPTMPLEELCRLPVAQLAAPNSVLFLWASGGQIPPAFQMMEAWGFKFIAQMIWDKERPGTGSHVRYRHENLFIATRGHPPAVPRHATPESILRSTSGKHSAKPIDAYVRIEEMYPEAAKIELFCRGEPRVGWAGWGNQCNNGRHSGANDSATIDVIKVREARHRPVTVATMPRLSGARCGVKLTGRPRVCSISEVCRWAPARL